MPSDFHPRVTVATIVCENSRFLMVEELIDNALKYNQPAGHLEANESLVDAAIRETLEETAWDVQMQGYLGVSVFNAPSGDTFIRHSFVAKALSERPNYALDEGIQRCLWLTRAEIESLGPQLRSPLILPTIDQFLADEVYPLAMVGRWR